MWPVDSVAVALTNVVGGRHPHVLVLDARDVTDRRAALEAVQAQSPRTVVTTLTAEYYRDRHFGGLVNCIRTTASTNVAFNGGTGSLANQYETFKLNNLPWFNVRFILRYNVYQVVNNNQNPFSLNEWPNPNGVDSNTFVLRLWIDF